MVVTTDHQGVVLGTSRDRISSHAGAVKLFPVEPRRGSQDPLRTHGQHAVIAAGGVEPDPKALLTTISGGDRFIAADGGYRLFQELGLPCHLLVGDFDTLSPDEVEAAKTSGVEVHRYPSRKDKSDLEIAIDHALQQQAERLTIIGALGGEWDHCLANLLAPLSLCLESGLWARLVTSTTEIFLTDRPVEVRASGCRVSLFSLSEVVSGLTLKGFEYELNESTLAQNQTLGLANRATTSRAEITFSAGRLLIAVMRP